MNRLTDLPGDVTELLTAIVAALDIPLASIYEADEEARYTVLDERASAVQIAVSTLLQYPGWGVLTDTSEYIRRETERYPLTYTPYRSEKPGAEG